MDVGQRGAGGSISSGTMAYAFDGWQIDANGGAADWSQQYSEIDETMGALESANDCVATQSTVG